MAFLLCLTVLASLMLSVASQTVSSDEAGHTLNVQTGNNFRRSCKGSGLTLSTSVYWNKDNVQLNTLSVVKPPFLATKRYTATFTPIDATSVWMNTSVTGAQLGDSGVYTCVVTNSDGAVLSSITTTVNVQQVVTHLRLYVELAPPIDNETVPEVGSTLTVTDKRRMKIWCISEGGHPEPTVLLKLRLNGAMHDVPTVMTKNVSQEGVDGLKYNRTDSITITDNDYYANILYNGWELLCTSYVASLAVKEATTVLNITPTATNTSSDAPTLSDCSIDRHAHVGDTDVYFICYVSSASVIDVTWKIGNETMAGDQVSGAFTTTVGEADANNDNKRRVEFSISVVASEHGGKFILSVANDHGTVGKEFNLVNNGEVSGSPTITSSIVVFLMATVLSLTVSL